MSQFVVDMSVNKMLVDKVVRNKIHFLTKGEYLHAHNQYDDDDFINAARYFRHMTDEDGVFCDDKDNNSISTNLKEENASTSVDEDDFEILNISSNETNILD